MSSSRLNNEENGPQDNTQQNQKNHFEIEDPELFSNNDQVTKASMNNNNNEVIHPPVEVSHLINDKPNPMRSKNSDQVELKKSVISQQSNNNNNSDLMMPESPQKQNYKSQTNNVDLEEYKKAYQKALAESKKLPQNNKKKEMVLVELEKITEEQNDDFDPYEFMGYRRKIIMSLFMMGNFFLNYDNGVIPAAQILIMNELNISTTQIAFMSSLVYVGLSFSSVFASAILTIFKAKHVLVLSFTFNAVSCFLFALSSDYFLLCVSRILLGVTQAFTVIYSPVWINEFAPKNSTTSWLATFQLFTVLGVMGGYVIGAITVDFEEETGTDWTWRHAFAVQGVFMFFLGCGFIVQDNNHLDIVHNENINQNESAQINKNIADASECLEEGNFNKMPPSPHYILQKNYNSSKLRSARLQSLSASNISRSDLNLDSTSNNLKKQANNVDNESVSKTGITKTEYQEIKAHLGALVTNGVFIFTTLTCSTIFFTATGIQFWFTTYAIKILNAEPVTAQIIFASCSVLAPIPGALAGGWISDLFGGYKGKNVITALKLCLVFGFCSGMFQVMFAFAEGLYQVVFCLFASLFFGASLVPTALGIIVSSVDREYQASASAVSQFINNMFGFFLAPNVSGFIMLQFDDQLEGLKWGFRGICLWSIWAILLMYFALRAAEKDQTKKGKDYKEFIDEEGHIVEVMDDGNNYSRKELKEEIQRRSRLNSYSF